jgi:hypothetical protein
MLNELDLDHVSDELPIACKLSGDELAKRGEEVDELFNEVEQVRELAGTAVVGGGEFELLS